MFIIDWFTDENIERSPEFFLIDGTKPFELTDSLEVLRGFGFRMDFSPGSADTAFQLIFKSMSLDFRSRVDFTSSALNSSGAAAKLTILVSSFLSSFELLEESFSRESSESESTIVSGNNTKISFPLKKS